MKRAQKKIAAGVIVLALIVGALTLYIQHYGIAVLEPAGEIGLKEKNLLIFASLLAIIVVVPTFILTVFISLKYREGNKKPKKYRPDFDHSLKFEAIWWGIPILIIGTLSVVAWNSAHTLDPYKAIASKQPALNVQVVSLDWKWLFIYPDQHIATVNYFVLPENRPVHFYATSDSVMTSLWLPSLGGQIYAMPGMKTQLYEEPTKAGTFYGANANISGEGFAHMRFAVHVVSQNQFTGWALDASSLSKSLDDASYQQLAKPSIANTETYGNVQSGLFDNIIMKYMVPNGSMKKTMPMPSKADSITSDKTDCNNNPLKNSKATDTSCLPAVRTNSSVKATPKTPIQNTMPKNMNMEMAQ